LSHELRPVDARASELLRALARNRSDSELPTIPDLAAQVSEWDTVLRLAEEHRVVPLLISCLPDIEKFVPPETRQALQTAQDRNAFHCLANASELISILGEFGAEDIPAMPFKGISLAASVYGDLTARSAGDLDFLVFYHDLGRATSALHARGFHLQTPTKIDGSPAVEKYYEYHFERPTDGMVAELRWRLELTEQQKFQRDLGMEWVWPRRSTVRIAGADVPDMNPMDKLLVLCMHATKHRWSRLVWICDVARVLETQPDLNWRAVGSEARRRGLWRCLALGVLLADRVCRANVPAAVLKDFLADRGVHRLAIAFAESLFDAPGRIPSSRVPYNLRILDFSDRIRWVLAMEFLRPNERDYAMVRLPAVLSPLYFVIRPIRLFLDRSAR